MESGSIHNDMCPDAITGYMFVIVSGGYIHKAWRSRTPCVGWDHGDQNSCNVSLHERSPKKSPKFSQDLLIEMWLILSAFWANITKILKYWFKNCFV